MFHAVFLFSASQIRQERGSDAVPDDIGETTLHPRQGVRHQARLVPVRRVVSE